MDFFRHPSLGAANIDSGNNAPTHVLLWEVPNEKLTFNEYSGSSLVVGMANVEL